MTKGDNQQKEKRQLRNQAEARLRAGEPELPPQRTESESQRLVHELAVHQVELEMQNEELQRARQELELSRNNYAELFDFAPVSYFTFDPDGLICEVNLAASRLLAVERGRLCQTPFARFIGDNEGREVFPLHLQAVRRQQATLRCEIKLRCGDGREIFAQLQSVAVASETRENSVLTAAIDVTVRRQLEAKLQQAHDRLEETVRERTAELTRANADLTREIEERKKTEASLQEAIAEIRRLTDRLQLENTELQQVLVQDTNFGELIGHSDAMAYVFYRIEQVAPQDATVLLLGETGTGKGMVAREIHRRSPRKDRPIITVNCTALPANLIESELFGREKGAFTGAHARQMGRFELADGGTIFLDEIGEMPLELQVKLLRVIQDGEFERLGSPRTIKVNVRIIAATNRNLEEEIRAGRFREDLFYRLSVFPITIPPLRRRTEDIPPLLHHFLAKFNKKIGRAVRDVPQATLKIFQEYPWPGNVRELESVIERALITTQGPTLQVLDRFDTFRKVPDQGKEVKGLAELEQDHILQVLHKTNWRVEGKNGAAVLLGLNPSTLRARMRKYGIRRS
ncbi:sigma-54-dependent transcriptional response regulator [Desulfuromonas sp. DDH964]|uniref:sigma-54-dependent transcriptional regulator n=1 Tax=Desulfuromonas sp. DDH964 TaxID=1823759 RepID=UPI00078E7167|nr:sigma-54 dependent transcriptional regulator [Desulfuromonas sp. DDH964]AMV73749.1 sigma-54-dependent transcriptional response regulator [Desulfuromonas sp. DDH964]